MGRGLQGHVLSDGKSTAGGDGSPGTAGYTGQPELRGEDYWLHIWSFGTSPYGLNLPERVLWSLTPREFSALKAEWAEYREFQARQVAGIQATMSNAWFKRSDGQHFVADDFMPGGRKPQSVEEKRAVIRSMLTRAAQKFAEGVN